MVAPFRFLGLIFLVLGVLFLICGLDLSDAFSNRFMKEMSGTYPKETTRYIFGGVIMILIGLGILGSRFYRKK